MTRRTTRWMLALAGVVLVLGSWAFWWEPASLRLERHHLAIGWPVEQPLRIAVLTDLHVGSPFNGLDKLRATVALTNAAEPELICILGDLMVQGVLGGEVVPPEAIALELANLRAPGGVVAVLGNHDNWFDHDRVRRAIEQANGGQVRFPLVGALVVPSRFGRRYASGHIVEGGKHMFVATGVGTSILPVRFRVPPAVSLLTVSR